MTTNLPGLLAIDKRSLRVAMHSSTTPLLAACTYRALVLIRQLKTVFLSAFEITETRQTDIRVLSLSLSALLTLGYLRNSARNVTPGYNCVGTLQDFSHRRPCIKSNTEAEMRRSESTD